MTLTFRNAHQALPSMIRILYQAGRRQSSRNGEVLMINEPVLLTLRRPMERVVFQPERNANPFFHFAEAMWMLAGRNDLSELTQYVKKIADFSDDGLTLRGAYGFRWRRHFGCDQIERVINNLTLQPSCRRQVISMWDPEEDLLHHPDMISKDVPCNTHIYCSVDEVAGTLNFTVCNRSNDLIWGMLGANSVHMTWLQEYMASRLGLNIGRYTVMTNNLHLYTEVGARMETMARCDAECPYSLGEVSPVRTFPEKNLLGNYAPGYLRTVAEPIVMSHSLFRMGKFDNALSTANSIGASDWRRACVEWLRRRIARVQKAQDDGVSYE